jgi:hypothetical protein
MDGKTLFLVNSRPFALFSPEPGWIILCKISGKVVTFGQTWYNNLTVAAQRHAPAAIL